MIDGLKANEQKLVICGKVNLGNSAQSHIGYLKASEIYKESMATNKVLKS
jgi:hypothetical protein